MNIVKEQHNFIDYSVFSESLEEMVNGDSLMVNAMNQYSYCLANKDEGFKKYLQQSNVLFPDRVAVVFAMNVLTVQFPNIKVDIFSPPFKSEFSEAENAEMIARVNDFNPDVLFVGMTAPKQEKWTYVHKKKLDVKIICTIGAVFDFYAGNINRASQVCINLGLEWFIRLIKEPKRMWRRYLYFGSVFIWLICKEKTKLMFSVNP